jgi:hypothetical protein
MKRTILLAVAVSFSAMMLAANIGATPASATCTGAKNCKACKNCKYCKHCKKDGGTCGVCK